MQPVPCFIYRENEHFQMPMSLSAPARHFNEFTVVGTDGLPHPVPELFHEVSEPDRAHFFLFPYDIGQYLDCGAGDAIADVIESLPYLRGREERNLVFDYADRPWCLPQRVALFKVSLLRPDAGRAVATWYRLPEHTLNASPSFYWDNIRYDISFVGKYTNQIRRAAVASIRQQAPELRFFLKVDDSLQVDGNVFNFKRVDPAHEEEKRRIFLQSINESWAVLCAPGIGPQSIRMYETMLLGRIPVLFGDNIQYPLEDRVDYGAFSVQVDNGSIMDTGNLLKEWFAAHSRDELSEKCVLSCKTWNRYFAKNKLHTLFAEAAKLFSW